MEPNQSKSLFDVANEGMSLSDFSTPGEGTTLAQVANTGQKLSDFSPDVQKPKDVYDVTVGAAEYGGSQTAEHLVKGIDRSWVSVPKADDFASSMQRFRKDHSEYAPIQVDNALGLLSDPRALSSNLFSNAAYLALQAGTSAIPIVGIPIAASTAYTIDAQRAYEQAKRNGATEDDATLAGKLTGSVNAGIQIMSDLRMFHVMKGDENYLSQAALRNTSSIARALAPTARVGQEAVTMGVLGALQGAVNEGIALSTYDQPIEPGFFDRRLQEGISGAVLAPFLAAAGKGYRTVFGEGTERPVEKDINVFDKNSAFQFFNQNGVPQDTARSMASIADSLASTWSVDSKLPKEKWYASVINEENFLAKPDPSNGAALQSTLGNLLESFDSNPDAGVDAFLHAAVQNLPLGRVAQLKDALKIEDQKTSPEEADAKMQTAFKRYLYDGQAPAPELVQPFGDMRELLRDIYKTGASTGQRTLKPQQRAAFDALMAPETDQIVAARGRLSELEKAYKEAFPKAKVEPNPYSPSEDQLKGLMTTDVQETKTRYEYPPDQDIPVAVDEVITRKRTPEELKDEIDRITEMNRQADVTAGNPDRTPVKAPEPEKAEISGLLRSKEEAATIVKSAYDELRRLQLGRLIPDEMSAVARRAMPDGYERSSLKMETSEDTRQRLSFFDAFTEGSKVPGWVSDKYDSLLKTIDPVREWFGSLASPLKRFPSGQALLEALSDQVSFARTVTGRYEERIIDAYNSLSYRERRWLRKEEVQGFTNQRRMLDTQGVVDHIANPPTPGLANWRDLMWKVNDDMGHLAERHGVLMRSPMDGTTTPYEQPTQARMLRFPTERAREAMRDGHGELWNSIVDAVKRYNPEIKDLKDGDVKSAMQNAFVDQEIKKNSALETARIFKVMPDIVYVNGKPEAIFHTDPIHYARTAVRSQSQRIAMQRIFGQDLLDTVRTKQVKKVADILGVTPEWNEGTLRAQLQDKLFANTETQGSANLKKEFLQTSVRKENSQAVLPDGRFYTFSALDLPSSDLPKLVKQAKDLGITVGLTKQDYVDAIQRVNAEKLDAKGFKALKKAAVELKGINPELPVHELLSEVKSRILEDPTHSIEDYVNKISREGGDAGLAMDVVKAAQGIPLYIRSKNFLARAGYTASSLIGTTQTSESVLRNITQTPVLVPLFAGMKNYVKAIDTVLKNYNETKSQIAGYGAVPITHFSYGIEKGYAMESIGKMIRQGATTATGLKFIADMNNVIAGEAFRNLANDWRSGGRIKSGDIASMKSLNLTPKEIEQVKGGQMSKETYAKIVQEGVALTQFVTQSGHLRSRLEHHPLAQFIAAYSNYAIGTGRALMEYVRNDLLPALNPKNSIPGKGRDVGIVRALTGMTTLLAGALGGGMASQILVSAWKGDGRKKMDDTVFDRMTGALMEVSLVGPTQRMLDSFRFGSADSWFVGLMPQVKFIADGITASVNELLKITGGKPYNTKNGRLDFADSYADLMKRNNPLLGDTIKWHDRVMNPKIGVYEEAKAASAKYIRDRKDLQGGSSDEAIDPLRQKVFFYVQRGDSKGAMLAAQEYYQNYFSEMKKDPKRAMIDGDSLQKATEGLHSSLVNRAPINLDPMRKMEFLSTLPVDRRRQYFKADTEYREIANAVAPVGSK